MTIPVELSRVLVDPYWRSREVKQAGRKVIGVSPMYFPEELIHASGALPVVMQEVDLPIMAARGHIFSNYCGVAVSNVDRALSGDLNFLDAVVITDICLHIRTSFCIMKRWMSIPFIYTEWPGFYNAEQWLSLSLRCLEQCKQQLQEITGNRITDNSILASIELYNRNRRLLQQIDSLRQKKPGILRASEMSALVISSMVMPKEEHNALLERLIVDLEKSAQTPSGRVRLYLSGQLCSAVKSDVLDLIEGSGGVAVADDFYAGARYFSTKISTSLPPMEALVRGFYDIAIPCPTRSGPEKDWAEYVIHTYHQSQAQGVIFFMNKWCSDLEFMRPEFIKRLNEAGIPHIFLDTEHEMVSLGGVKTRIEAFVEMLQVKEE